MRPLSAAELKRGRGRSCRQDVPREGTRLRSLYDTFFSNRGRIVSINPAAVAGNVAVRRLTDDYGLDLRNVGYGRWLLAGEWEGRAYIDYVAERYEAAE